jgi:hypothetical protein
LPKVAEDCRTLPNVADLMNLLPVLTLNNKAPTGEQMVLTMALTGEMIGSVWLTSAFIVSFKGFIVLMMTIICVTGTFIVSVIAIICDMKAFIVIMIVYEAFIGLT